MIRNPQFTISLVLLGVSIACFVGMALLMKYSVTINRDNQTDCEQKPNCGDGCCGIWEDGMCRKGKIKIYSNGIVECEAHGNPWLLVLLSVGSLCVIGFIVFLILGLKK